MQAVRSIKPTVKNEVMRMKRKYKLAATLDVFAALCLFACMVYLLFFAFAVLLPLSRTARRIAVCVKSFEYGLRRLTIHVSV